MAARAILPLGTCALENRGSVLNAQGSLPHVNVHATDAATLLAMTRHRCRPVDATLALDLDAKDNAKDNAKSPLTEPRNDAGSEESKAPVPFHGMPPKVVPFHGMPPKVVTRVKHAITAIEGLHSWEVKKARYLHFTPLFWEPQMRNLCEDAVMVRDFCTSIHAMNDKGAHKSKFTQFYVAKTVALTWRANALEIGVLDRSGDTQRFMWELAGHPDGQAARDGIAAVGAMQWNASGKSNLPPQWRRLGLQSMMAWRVLEHAAKKGRPLTRALIEKTHAVLMDGAQRDDGPHSSGAVPAGVLRAEDVRAGDFVFPRFSVVPERLAALCEKFERDLATGHAVEAAALLLLAFVTLHPFVDGNGRTCRLLFAYALMRAGFPFPVVFSSGHKKAREHYMRALIAAQQRRHYWGVYAIAWASVVRCVNNYDVF